METKMGKDKRKYTATLPVGWRENLFDSIRQDNTRLRDAVAVLQLTGCRPDELEKGVLVEFAMAEDGEPDCLIFTIAGSKVGLIEDLNGRLHERGQPFREIGVGIAGNAAIYLVDRANTYGVIKISYNRKSISARLGELSRLVFPNKREHISGYCYRHQFSMDLKNADVERTAIAAALGHLSDYSCGAYGKKSKRKGGVALDESPILAATATKEIKHSRKTDRLLRFKISNLRKKM
jgi:integrase